MFILILCQGIFPKDVYGAEQQFFELKVDITKLTVRLAYAPD